MNLKSGKDGELHKGHRARMRTKLLTHGERVFETYELFEMLLYTQIKYRDTNDVAKRLFKTFGTADAILKAQTDELLKVEGIGERCAAFINEVGKAPAFFDMSHRCIPAGVTAGFETVGEYLVDCYDGCHEKKVLLLLFNNKLNLIEKLVIYNGEYGSAAVKPKDFVNKALQRNASVAVIAFNHPYGAMFPTESESATNKAVEQALHDSGIYLAETYLVSGKKYMGLVGSDKYKTFLQSPELISFYRGFGWDMTVFSSAPAVADELSLSVPLSKASVDYLSGLLMSVCDRQTATNASEALFDRYGTLRDIMMVSVDNIISSAGISLTGAILIKLVAYVSSRRVTELFRAKRKYTEEQLKSCISALFIGDDVEKIYAFFLGDSGELKAYEQLGGGSVNSSGFIPRVFVERALKHDAKEVILAHNHPFGVTEPSKEDVMMTAQFKSAFYNLGINLSAHFIVAGKDCEAIRMQ